MIDAAGRLLRRGGIEEVTHLSVAVEAGVGRATVYRHWPRQTDLLMDALADAALVVDFGDGDLRTRLLHELGQRLSEINSPMSMALVGMLVGRGEHDEDVHALRIVIFGRVIDAISDVIAAAVHDGQLRPGAPGDELAKMILGALLIQRSLLGRDLSPEYLETVVDATLRGWWSDDR